MEPANLVEGTDVEEGTDLGATAGTAGQLGAAESLSHGTSAGSKIIDEEDTNDELSTAAAVSASGVLGAWHSGCRGPSPSGAWVV